MYVESKAFNEDGKEIEIPENHHMIISNRGIVYVPYAENEKIEATEFTYKAPFDGDNTGQEMEIFKVKNGKKKSN